MPIDVVCGGCEKRFRLKDDLAGKRFQCKSCGQILTAQPSTSAAADSETKPQAAPNRKPKTRQKTTSSQGGSERAPRVSLSPKKPQNFDEDPIPDPFADDYDKPEAANAFDDLDDPGDDYGEDFADDYAAPPPKKRKKKKATVKAKGFKKAKPKSSFSDGLPPMTFNLNRLNAGFLILGGILIFAGIKELRLTAGANSAAKEVSLASLYADGPGDDVYFTITGAEPVTDFYVATETRFGKMSEVWYACAPEDVRHQPRFLLYSTAAHTDEDVALLMSNRTHTGMLISNVSGLDAETKGLFRQNVPGIDVDSPMIFQVGRGPSSFLKWAGMILGGIIVLLGGLFWIFFVHD